MRDKRHERIKLDIGYRVRSLRSAMHWSQEVLGEKAGLHEKYIGEIERGETNVSLVNLSCLADAFGMSLAEFCDLPEQRQSERTKVEKKILLVLRRQNIRALKLILSFTEVFENWIKGG